MSRLIRSSASAAAFITTATLLFTGAAFGQDTTGDAAAEKYQGFAEDNPDLVDDRGNRLQKDAGQDVEDEGAVTDTSGSEVYPEEIVEGNAPLTPDVPDQEPPYSEQADVHGDFGEGNPDVQR